MNWIFFPQKSSADMYIGGKYKKGGGDVLSCNPSSDGPVANIPPIDLESYYRSLVCKPSV